MGGSGTTLGSSVFPFKTLIFYNLKTNVYINNILTTEISQAFVPPMSAGFMSLLAQVCYYKKS